MALASDGKLCVKYERIKFIQWMHFMHMQVDVAWKQFDFIKQSSVWQLLFSITRDK
jgi:hypothetical protein